MLPSPAGNFLFRSPMYDNSYIASLQHIKIHVNPLGKKNSSDPRNFLSTGNASYEHSRNPDIEQPAVESRAWSVQVGEIVSELRANLKH